MELYQLGMCIFFKKGILNSKIASEMKICLKFMISEGKEKTRSHIYL